MEIIRLGQETALSKRVGMNRAQLRRSSSYKRGVLETLAEDDTEDWCKHRALSARRFQRGRRIRRHGKTKMEGKTHSVGKKATCEYEIAKRAR